MHLKEHAVHTCFLFLLLASGIAFGQVPEDTDIAQDKEHLIVGATHSPPFMFKEDGDFRRGVAFDLWQNIAEDMGVTYEFREYELSGMLEALRNGDVDLCVNPLTVNSERIKGMDFSFPFYSTNLAILVPREEEGLMYYLQSVFSVAFLQAVLLLALVIFVFGFLLWLVEQRGDPDMFQRGWKGVGEGFWWSAVTMTTVGYGDKVPSTTAGRVIATIWMFTAVIIVSSFTASIASSLTVQKSKLQVETVNDLRNVAAGTVEASNSSRFLSSSKIQHRTYPGVREAIRAVEQGEVRAIVYDEPLLRYFIRDMNLDNELTILNNKFQQQNYSFGVPKGSPILKELNIELVEELESKSWEAIKGQYNLN